MQWQPDDSVFSDGVKAALESREVNGNASQPAARANPQQVSCLAIQCSVGDT